MTYPSKPAFRAYTTIKREGHNDFWLPIGAAFRHSDDEGLNVVLQALPIDGRIVLRTHAETGEPEESTENRRHARR